MTKRQGSLKYLIIIWISFVLHKNNMAGATVGFRNAAHGAKLSEANVKFAMDLYKAIEAEKGGANVFFSPASISVALAMTYSGARNNTSAEMKKAMSLSALEDCHLHDAFEDLHSAVTKTNGNYTLLVANKLFVERKYNILQQFFDKTKTHYKAEAKAVDFSTKYAEAREMINKWVEEQTNSKIKDLMPDGSIDGLTRLVLVNAVYFKGNWELQFKTENTKDRDFTLASGEKVKTPLMFQKEKFNMGYNKDLNCKVLELPYLGGKMSMFFLLPATAQGLQNLTNSLTAAHLLDPVKAFKMRKIEVHVTIPKFKVEMSMALPNVLQHLGMKDLFVGGKADLSGIDGTQELFVGGVQHKAFIEVNEEGSEAAAATGVKLGLRSMPRIAEFTADKPFLYFIRENSTQSLLFLGAMKYPGNSAPRDEL